MRFFSGLLLLAIIPLTSCGGPGGSHGIAKSPVHDDDQQAMCKVAKDPLNPLIVEWPGTSKASLDSASQNGVVVVSYVGCVLKVLASCQAGGAYEFRGITPVRDKVTIENESELYARLPLGVASLKGDLQSAGRLDLEYVAVGQRETPKPPVSLSGECAGATHYVRSIMIGAYGLDAVGKASAAAGVDIAGNGGSAEESVRRLRGSGDVSACASGGDKAKPDCGAVLQLGLVPLMVDDSGAVTSAGFGAGLGAMTVVSAVQEITTLPRGSQSLAAANVVLLKALQEAKRADKSNVSMTDKASAWDAFARFEGANPYKELAERRRDDWTRAAEAEARRKKQLVKVCERYESDRAKLARLVALDDAVVSKAQKDAYQQELAQVYAPFQGELRSCDAVRNKEAIHRAEAERKAAEQVRVEQSRAREALTGRMVLLPAGSFDMGSNDGEPNEKPVHRVSVNAFWMDVTEVTVNAYAACVKEGGCSADELKCNDAATYGVVGKGNHPINCVDWNQATAFCQWVGKRLPTEEEWEYAARGTDGRTYPWGNEAPGQLCWNRWDSEQGTCAVGSFPADKSPFGLFDMAGNVWEWTSSGWSNDYSKNRVSTHPVYRGGSWVDSIADDMRASYRFMNDANNRYDYLGVRCAW